MSNLFTPPKVVEGSLVGVDGNIFVILGHFRKLARRSGWTDQELKQVESAVTSSTSYEQAVSTILMHMDDGDETASEANSHKPLTNEEIEHYVDKVEGLTEAFRTKSTTTDKSDGKSVVMETNHGEALSAVGSLCYEFENNDNFFYALESQEVGKHAKYLMSIGINGVDTLINRVVENADFDKDSYLQFLGRLAKLVIEWVESSEDSPNQHPNHWRLFDSRWQFVLCEECGDVTEGWESCSCCDEEDEYEDE